mmetsp:Transcript_34968/g.109321  ORF Transcript_34968/g.109321 Transcript_34968/m.109321 type:complete len:263 (+) Transcript_34968:84-872(+)
MSVSSKATVVAAVRDSVATVITWGSVSSWHPSRSVGSWRSCRSWGPVGSRAPGRPGRGCGSSNAGDSFGSLDADTRSPRLSLLSPHPRSSDHTDESWSARIPCYSSCSLLSSSSWGAGRTLRTGQPRRPLSSPDARDTRRALIAADARSSLQSRLTDGAARAHGAIGARGTGSARRTSDSSDAILSWRASRSHDASCTHGPRQSHWTRRAGRALKSPQSLQARRAPHPHDSKRPSPSRRSWWASSSLRSCRTRGPLSPLPPA